MEFCKPNPHSSVSKSPGLISLSLVARLSAISASAERRARKANKQKRLIATLGLDRMEEPAAGVAPAAAAAADAAIDGDVVAEGPLVDAEPDPPAPAMGHEDRAGDDGWPRLWIPSARGYVRLSINASGATDFRGVCLQCNATRSGTCAPPPVGARPGTKKYGQGRPLGKCWSWVRHADSGPHTREQHKLFVPSLAQRRAGRTEAEAAPGSELWRNAERPARDDELGGEPLDLP